MPKGLLLSTKPQKVYFLAKIEIHYHYYFNSIKKFHLKETFLRGLGQNFELASLFNYCRVRL